jgi:pentose-5-phosphate-3-epimerase
VLEISSVALQYWIEELMNIEVDGGINKDTIHRSANPILQKNTFQI